MWRRDRGKTTLTLHAIANAQRAGGIAAFIDAEHALDPEYAQKLGVDIDALLVSQPDTGEQALEIADMLIRSGSVDLVVKMCIRDRVIASGMSIVYVLGLMLLRSPELAVVMNRVFKRG